MLIVGIDDTDSERGFCTTYLAAVLIERLRASGHHTGAPKLVRPQSMCEIQDQGKCSHSQYRWRLMTLRRSERYPEYLLELSDLSG